MANNPTHFIYHGKPVGKDKRGKKIWTRVGAVWPARSGKASTITWEYLPLVDGITVMLPYSKKQAEYRYVVAEEPA